MANRVSEERELVNELAIVRSKGSFPYALVDRLTAYLEARISDEAHERFYSALEQEKYERDVRTCGNGS